MNKKQIYLSALVMLTALTIFVSGQEVTYQQFTQALYKAQNFIAESNFRKLENILPELK